MAPVTIRICPRCRNANTPLPSSEWCQSCILEYGEDAQIQAEEALATEDLDILTIESDEEEV